MTSPHDTYQGQRTFDDSKSCSQNPSSQANDTSIRGFRPTSIFKATPSGGRYVSSESLPRHRRKGYRGDYRSPLNPLMYSPEDRHRRRDNHLWETEAKLVSQPQTGAVLGRAIETEWARSHADIASDHEPKGRYKEYRQRIARQVRAEWRARVLAGYLAEDQMIEADETLGKWIEDETTCSRKARDALLLLAITVPPELRHMQYGEDINEQASMIADLVYGDYEKRRPLIALADSSTEIPQADLDSVKAMLAEASPGDMDGTSGVEVSASVKETDSSTARLTVNIDTKDMKMNPDIRLVKFGGNELSEGEMAEMFNSAEASRAGVVHSRKVIIRR